MARCPRRSPDPRDVLRRRHSGSPAAAPLTTNRSPAPRPLANLRRFALGAARRRGVADPAVAASGHTGPPSNRVSISSLAPPRRPSEAGGSACCVPHLAPLAASAASCSSPRGLAHDRRGFPDESAVGTRPGGWTAFYRHVGRRTGILIARRPSRPRGSSASIPTTGSRGGRPARLPGHPACCRSTITEGGRRPGRGLFARHPGRL